MIGHVTTWPLKLSDLLLSQERRFGGVYRSTILKRKQWDIWSNLKTRTQSKRQGFYKMLIICALIEQHAITSRITFNVVTVTLFHIESHIHTTPKCGPVLNLYWNWTEPFTFHCRLGVLWAMEAEDRSSERLGGGDDAAGVLEHGVPLPPPIKTQKSIQTATAGSMSKLTGI